MAKAEKKAAPVKAAPAKKAAPVKKAAPAKKAAPEKKAAPAKKAVAKKEAAPKVKRKPNAAFMAPLKVSATMAKVIGSTPMPRTEIVKKVWEYIKKHGLQDKANKRMINADATLKEVFEGKTQVSMFDLAKIVNSHVQK